MKKMKTKTKVCISVDTELLEKFDRLYPKMKSRLFTATIDKCIKSREVLMRLLFNITE